MNIDNEIKDKVLKGAEALWHFILYFQLYYLA
jgi:hypothetical protein